MHDLLASINWPLLIFGVLQLAGAEYLKRRRRE